MLSDGILAVKEPPGRGFVDQNHWRRRCRIRIGEQAAADERNAHGAEIAGCDAAHRYLRLRGGFGFTTDDTERIGEAGIEWMLSGDGCRIDARQALSLLEYPARERVDLLEVWVAAKVDRITARRQLILGLQHSPDRKPASTCWSRQKLLMSSVAPMTSITARAHSAITRMARSRERSPPADEP